MKIYFKLAIFSLSLGYSLSLLHAQQAPFELAHKNAFPDGLKPPALLVKDGHSERSPLGVESLDIQTTVTGNTAETTMTMEFRNSTDRVLEGELVFPLGQGMSISGYALDVNGKMRRGVIVEKQRARQAYEDTIRQKIDPGIVEWTKGNKFRTRIYPIPAKGTKKVSISYVETLPTDGENLRLQIPLAFSEPISDFKLNVNVVRPSGHKQVTIEDDNGLKLTMDATKGWKLQAREKDFLANKTLKFSIPQETMARKLVHKDKQNELFFYVVDDIEHEKLHFARPIPKSLHLVWDASHSGAQRNHAKELSLLEAYLNKNKLPSIRLQILRNTLEPIQEFDLSEGPAALIAHLKSLRYDGATSLGALDFDAIDSDAIVWVSDGIATLGQERPKLGSKPLFIFHASQSAEHSLLDFISAQTGGAYVNLEKISPSKALEVLCLQQFSLLSAEGEGLEELYPSVPTPVERQVSIAGKISSKKPVDLVLKYGLAGKVLRTKKITIDPALASNEADKVPRLWAQKKLGELDTQAKKNRDEIVKLAQRHGIVTRFSSLIVLDRIEDYVKHRITPPEPGLREQYQKLLREELRREAQPNKHLEGIIEQWQQWVKWHKGSYFGVGDILIAEAARDAKLFNRIESDIVAKMSVEKDGKKRASLKSQMEAIEALKKIQNKAAEEGQKNPKIGAKWAEEYQGIFKKYRRSLNQIDAHYALTKEAKKRLKFSNKQSEAQAVFSVSSGSETRSSLGLRSGDVLSSQGKAIELDFEEGDRFGDGFGEGFGRAGGGADRSSLQNLKIFGKAASMRNAGVSLAKPDPNTPYLKALRQALKEGADLEDIYFQWKLKNLRRSAFYLDAADFFFQQGQKTIGLRIISNLAELDIENPALMRILAHRYQQLKQLDLAELIFREVLELRAEEPQSYRDLALVLEKKGDVQEAADLLWHVVSNAWDPRLRGIELIALTELNALIAQQAGKLKTDSYEPEAIYNLDADVRIVLTWDADNTDIDLWVTGPLGERCNYSHNMTRTGGMMSRDFTEGYGPEVFMIKNAMNGEYKVQANYYRNRRQTLAGSVTLQATLITHWGRKNETRKAITLRLTEQKSVIDVGALTFSAE